jgi:hypothetical protein
MNIIYFPHAVFSSLVSITQMSEVQPGHNFMDLSEFSAGAVGPQFTGTHMASPDNRFSTTQIKGVLDVCISGDYRVARDMSGTTVDAEFRAGDLFGARASTGVLANIRMRMADNSMLCWESLSARQGGLAELRVRSFCASVGGNDPLVTTSGTTLNAASAVNHLYTLGPVKLNGTTHQGVQEASLDNNLSYIEEGAEGDGFPTFIGLDSYAPILTFRTRDLSVLSTYGNRGTPLTALTWYLRKKLNSSINVPNATPQHIAITAAAGTIKARQVSGPKPMAEVSVALQVVEADTVAFEVTTISTIT